MKYVAPVQGFITGIGLCKSTTLPCVLFANKPSTINKVHAKIVLAGVMMTTSFHKLLIWRNIVIILYHLPLCFMGYIALSA